MAGVNFFFLCLTMSGTSSLSGSFTGTDSSGGMASTVKNSGGLRGSDGPRGTVVRRVDSSVWGVPASEFPPTSFRLGFHDHLSYSASALQSGTCWFGALFISSTIVPFAIRSAERFLRSIRQPCFTCTAAAPPLKTAIALVGMTWFQAHPALECFAFKHTE